MTNKFVDLEALNLRSTPDKSSLANRIAILHLGQPVKEIGPTSVAGWVEIDAAIEGATKRGVVMAEINGLLSLRDTVTPAREALVAEAIKEWLRFEKGQGKDHVDPFFKYVGEIWRAIGQDLDGEDIGIPWGGAAISFMVRNASKNFPKYKNFRFAASKVRFVHNAIVKRNANDTEAPFWGFRLHEKHPEVGDMVVKSVGVPSNFEDIENGKIINLRSPIIVSVRADFVLTISGNVNQSVS